MRRVLGRRLILLCTAMLAAASGLGAVTLTRADYAAHQRQIEADYKLERAGCDRLTANDKDVCVIRAKGHEKVAKAELDYNNTGDPTDQIRLTVARADTAFAVALERCDERTRAEKDLCRKQADAAHSRALADTRLDTTIDGTAGGPTAAKRDTDYNAALARCEGLVGTPKASCTTLARTRFGKS